MTTTDPIAPWSDPRTPFVGDEIVVRNETDIHDDTGLVATCETAAHAAYIAYCVNDHPPLEDSWFDKIQRLDRVMNAILGDPPEGGWASEEADEYVLEVVRVGDALAAALQVARTLIAEVAPMALVQRSADMKLIDSALALVEAS